MQPNLAQVLNALAHEIRTPLAVSQGYLKLFLDGRLKNEEDTRRAMEQTRQALGALATLCLDMGKVSALADDRSIGVPGHITCGDLITALRAHDEVAGAQWEGDAGHGSIATSNASDLAQAVAIASRAAFDENRDAPRAFRVVPGTQLTLLAGADGNFPADQDAANTRPVDFVKGGKGLKLIWAAFVLDRHRIETWVDPERRASIGFRIPLVHA